MVVGRHPDACRLAAELEEGPGSRSPSRDADGASPLPGLRAGGPGAHVGGSACGGSRAHLLMHGEQQGRRELNRELRSALDCRRSPTCMEASHASWPCGHLSPTRVPATRVRAVDAGDRTADVGAAFGDVELPRIRPAGVSGRHRPHRIRAGLLRAALAGLAGEPVRVLAVFNRRAVRAVSVPGTVPSRRLALLRAAMPRCQAIVCQAGHGTLARALHSGVPVFACPTAATRPRPPPACAGRSRVSLPRRFHTPRWCVGRPARARRPRYAERTEAVGAVGRPRRADRGSRRRSKAWRPIPLGVKWAMAVETRGYTATRSAQEPLAPGGGQVRGIERMGQKDRYCIDILTQIVAVQAASRQVALGLLDDPARHCVIGADGPSRRSHRRADVGRRAAHAARLGHPARSVMSRDAAPVASPPVSRESSLGSIVNGRDPDAARSPRRAAPAVRSEAQDSGARPRRDPARPAARAAPPAPAAARGGARGGAPRRWWCRWEHCCSTMMGNLPRPWRAPGGRLHLSDRRGTTPCPRRRGARAGGLATGTGFVVRNDGTLVTNAHVVGDAETAQVRFADKGELIDAEVSAPRVLQFGRAARDPGSVDRLNPLPWPSSSKFGYR